MAWTEDPDALAARLVMGDELMSKGDPRGELIVVQCELERGGFDRTRGIHLRRRERELLDHAHSFFKGTPLEWLELGYRRGMVDQITLGVDAWARDEDAIWQLAPHLRHVRLHGFQEKTTHWGVEPPKEGWTRIRDLVGPALASGRITSFCALDPNVVWNRSGGSFEDDHEMKSVADRIAAWLIETKIMSRLRGLELSQVESATLALLAAEPMAEGLDELLLDHGSAYDHSILPALETTKPAPKRLLLSCGYGVVPDRRLLATPLMARVTDLTLPGLADFSDFPVGKQLRRLKTTINHQTGWVESLACSAELAGIEELVLAANYNQQEALDLRALYEPKHLDALRVLRIDRSVTPESAKELLRSPLGRRLEVLDLRQGSSELGRALRETEWDGLLQTSG